MDLGYRAVLFVKSLLLLVSASLFCYCPDELKTLLGFVCFMAPVNLPNILHSLLMNFYMQYTFCSCLFMFLLYKPSSYICLFSLCNLNFVLLGLYILFNILLCIVYSRIFCNLGSIIVV